MNIYFIFFTALVFLFLRLISFKVWRFYFDFNKNNIIFSCYSFFFHYSSLTVGFAIKLQLDRIWKNKEFLKYFPL